MSIIREYNKYEKEVNNWVIKNMLRVKCSQATISKFSVRK